MRTKKRKRTKNKTIPSADKTQYYRWQVLRRNEDYRQRFDSYNAYLSRIKDESAKEQLPDDIKSDLFEDFGINGMYDYRDSIPPAGLKIEGDNPPAQKGTTRNIFENRCTKNQHLEDHYLIERIHFKDPETDESGICSVQKYVGLVINCDFTLKEVINGVKKIYSSTRRVRQRGLRITRITKLTRSSIQDLRKCLSAYDLRMKKHKLVYIGKKIYPHNSVNSSYDRVRKNINRARALIDGGYRHIVG